MISVEKWKSIDFSKMKLVKKIRHSHHDYPFLAMMDMQYPERKDVVDGFYYKSGYTIEVISFNGRSSVVVKKIGEIEMEHYESLVVSVSDLLEKQSVELYIDEAKATFNATGDNMFEISIGRHPNTTQAVCEAVKGGLEISVCLRGLWLNLKLRTNAVRLSDVRRAVDRFLFECNMPENSHKKMIDITFKAN